MVLFIGILNLVQSPRPAEEPTGYRLCLDNIQLSSHRKQQGPKRSSNFHLMALCFAVRHRSPLIRDDEPRKEAQVLDGMAFLPSDLMDLRNRMTIIVQRILVHHLPKLKALRVHRAEAYFTQDF